MPTLDETINFEIIEVILNFKKTENIQSITDYIPLDWDNITVSNHAIVDIEENNKVTELHKLLINYSVEDIRKAYVFYLYGRHIITILESLRSYFELLEDNENYCLEQLIKKIVNIEYIKLHKAFDAAKQNWCSHEIKVAKERDALAKRVKSYIKNPPYSYFPLGQVKESIPDLTIQSFKEICSEIDDGITDINKANDIISKIIKKTHRQVIVDFLGQANFDHLDHVENDNEILKLYWKYSFGNNEFPFPPHNRRVDIAFEKMEKFDFSTHNTSIILKGFYRNKKEIKEYYHSDEKIKKMYYLEESKSSHFYYEMNFDKRQRGSIENFDVTFLPWRYFNIIILPKEDLPSTGYTSNLLIARNLIDLRDRASETYKHYYNNYIDDEDYIAMYGNRFRRLTENLLKFILLASKFMFEDDYEKDMLGSILKQMKKNQNVEFSLYNTQSISEIIKLVENSLKVKLNLCSHDNVRHKIDTQIIEDIYNDFLTLLKLSKTYFFSTDSSR